MIRRDALSEYVRASLWVLPTLSVLAALAAGALLSAVNVGVHSPLAFQGTPDDARNLLIGISGTMVTVIALLLGLAVVALQLSSTQFSPRLLRNFLRDRPNQIVLSAFVATFAYSAAGLYTVGVSGGNRTASFPRLAVSGSLVLLFLSLGLLVFFADHLAHSIQVDTIMDKVQRTTVTVIEHGLLTGGEDPPEVPAGATVVTSRQSGYVQAVHCSDLLAQAARYGVCVRLRARIGEHVVAGTTLAWIWPVSPVSRGGPSTGPAAVRTCPGKVGADRVRAHPGAGRRVRHPATGRHGVQGAVPRGQRSLHRRPGDRSPVGDLLRAGPAAPRRSRGPPARWGGGHRARAAVS